MSEPLLADPSAERSLSAQDEPDTPLYGAAQLGHDELLQLQASEGLSPTEIHNKLPFSDVVGCSDTPGQEIIDADLFIKAATLRRGTNVDSLLASSQRSGEAHAEDGDDPEDNLSERLLHGSEDAESARLKKSVVVIFCLSFFSMCIQMVQSPIQYLYIEDMGWVSDDNITYYTIEKLIAVILPVILNPPFGMWQQRRSAKEVYVSILVVVVLGNFLMAFTTNKWAFLVGYAAGQLLIPLRTVRSTYIAKTVDDSVRTQTMALNTAFIPIGALVGSLTARGIGALNSYDKDLEIGAASWHFNQYTLNFAVCGLLGVVNFIVAFIFMYKPKGGEFGRAVDNKPHPEYVRVNTMVGGERHVHTRRWATRIFVFFCICMFGVNFSMGFVQLAFQPVMVEFFDAGPGELETIFTIISVLALIPPLMVFGFAKYGIQDRYIMVFGLMFKIGGVLCFSCPFTGHVSKLQVIIGFICVIKASIFFFTSIMSLFSKILGPYASGGMFGTIGAMSAIGPAIATGVSGPLINKTFDTWYFPLLGIPAIVASILLLIMFKRLNPERDFVKQIHKSAYKHLES